jgi:cell division cycle 2-like protein
LLKEKVVFNELQVKRLMKDLLLGIDFLHQKNIVHRDLKTSNLLYSNEGILKICDFGLARRVSAGFMTQ